METRSLRGERDPGLRREGPRGAAGRAGGGGPRRGGPLRAADGGDRGGTPGRGVGPAQDTGAQGGGGWRTRTLENRALGLDPGGERGGAEEAEETGARRTREKDTGEAPKTFFPGVAEPSFSFAWHGSTAGPGAVRGRGSLGCRGPQLLLLVVAGAEGGEQGRERGRGWDRPERGAEKARGSEKGVRRRKGAVRFPSLVPWFPQVCWAPAAHLPPRPDPFPRRESGFFPYSSAPSLPQPSALLPATWENRSGFQGSGLLQMLARARVPGFQSAKGRVGREGTARAWSGAGPWLRTSRLRRSLGASPRIPDGGEGKPRASCFPPRRAGRGHAEQRHPAA
ncbi:collagen alpha-2(I) chain-like [Cebus imitator]|uniref:collagen alpha-2(I) chain-like n=1 Tax=Cebus imitator TaxID=2715852 RepID=UPI0018981D1B|nr:collagen alpha-2(I) chain-like [Cebus imitator]